MKAKSNTCKVTDEIGLIFGAFGAFGAFVDLVFWTKTSHEVMSVKFVKLNTVSVVQQLIFFTKVYRSYKKPPNCHNTR